MSGIGDRHNPDIRIATVRGQVFSLDYDDYDGTLISAYGMLEYDLFKPFGIRAGYALLQL